MDGIERVVGDIHHLAKGLRRVRETLETSGEMVSNEVKSNLDRSQNAGEFRSVETSDDGGPKSTMRPLADYTIEKRREEGYDSIQPLKETGEMRRAVGIIFRSNRQVRVGVKGRRNRMKQWRTLGTATTGEKSTDLGHDIPGRNPWGYSRQLLDKLLSMWYNRLSVEGDVGARVEARLKL